MRVRRDLGKAIRPRESRGPEWHPEKNARKEGRMAKMGDDNLGGDKTKRSEQDKKSKRGVCPVRPELHLFT